MDRLNRHTDLWIIAVFGLFALGLAAAFFSYVSIVPIFLIGAAALVVLCAAALALASGRLQRWVEIVDEAKPQPGH